MQNTIMIITILVGMAALTLSLVPLIMVLRRKPIKEMNQLDLEARISEIANTFISQKELEPVFKKVEEKYANGIRNSKGMTSVGEEGMDVFTLRVNADTLLQLPFLPWMTPDRIKNTVTDLLGLSLSRTEKEYVCHMIKGNIEKCKKVLPLDTWKSVAQIFKKVLEQMIL